MRFFYSVVILCILFSKAASANDSATEVLAMLKNMTQSFSTLSYDGVFVHSETHNMNSMRVRHYLNNGVEYESLVDLDGEKLEVIRIGDKVTHVYPDLQMSNTTTPPMPPLKRFKSIDGERLKLGYTMSINPHSSRIADRAAIDILLVPKDGYRYGHRFWLDKENHFLLKHDILKEDGGLLERVQFTSVNFTPDLKDEDFASEENKRLKQIIDVQTRQIKNLWSFERLPVGFYFVWPEARALSHGATMLLLSDGMSTVSVFVEPTTTSLEPSFLSIGATMAGEQSIEAYEQLFLLTIVGEVPKGTIEMLMSSFKPRERHD